MQMDSAYVLYGFCAQNAFQTYFLCIFLDRKQSLILYALLRTDYGLQLLQAVKMDPAESQLSF